MRRREQSMPLWRWGVCLIAWGTLGAMGAGCAAKQETTQTRQARHVQHFECLPDRWEAPPEEIGQTPPDQSPSARDIDPFITDDSTDQD